MVIEKEEVLVLGVFRLVIKTVYSLKGSIVNPLKIRSILSFEPIVHVTGCGRLVSNLHCA